jgi:hypothetical protein
VDRPREQRGAVEHGGVDHLPCARSGRLDDPAHDPEREQEPATAEVAEEVERRHPRLARPADHRERAREGDVVDVAPGGLRSRPGLAPAGHAAVDEGRPAREARVRPDAEALGNAGPEALDERVGALDEA